jgi:sigma-B regulation protein RsbU (phosphoserine phosphatase)
MTHLNRHLAGKRINQSFVTAFYGVLDAGGGEVRFACAGHPMPLARGTDGAVRALPLHGGLPLGIDEACGYESYTAPLQAGATLVLYTDGITEARAPSGAMFDEEGLARTLASAPAGAPCALLKDAVLAALAAHQGSRRPTDDQTLLLARLG